MISVKHLMGDEWAVTVNDATSTHHRVRVTGADVQRLSEGRPPEELIRESFRFLLEHEPNTAILNVFDLSLIGSYFPDYEHEIRRRLRE